MNEVYEDSQKQANPSLFVKSNGNVRSLIGSH